MRVLLRRRGDGIGDWLMMLACMKHVNEQQPDVELFVDFDLRRSPRRLSPIVREAFQYSDVRWSPAAPGDQYDVVVEHLVYQRQGDEKSYIESMLAQLARLTGRELVFVPDLYPAFVTAPTVAVKFAATVSCGKKETAYKDWPARCFDELAARLYRAFELEIVQLGRVADPPLRSVPVTRYLDVTFGVLAMTLRAARLFVGLENGLSQLAVMLGTPTIVVYNHGADPRRFDGRTVARLVRPSVEEVFNVCQGVLC